MEYRRAILADAETVSVLESASYPADEAASLDNIRKRISEAGEYFLLAHLLEDTKGEEQPELAGFVNGTLTCSKELTHDSMYTHEPEGTILCIHSVVVAPSLGRKGLGTKILGAYLDMIKEKHKTIKEVRLICKEYLQSFYKKAGFHLVGPSQVVHGQDK